MSYECCQMSADPGSRIHVAAWGYAEAAFAVSLAETPLHGLVRATTHRENQPGCTMLYLP